jgi:hypothetical protein
VAIPLPILGAIVVGGVTGVVLLTRLVGWAKPERLRSLDEAFARFVHDEPEAQMEEGVLADNHMAALLKLKGEGVGVVLVMGDKQTTRRLSPDLVKGVKKRSDGFRIRLRDPGFPRVDIKMADASAVEKWTAWLGC